VPIVVLIYHNNTLNERRMKDDKRKSFAAVEKGCSSA